ncbi:choline kinase family protein [Breznakia pachnodae]|uniref:Thiamine kinase-like enzyme n=1 Tax=Breznakia pachnodae TaxID=265178 RepID=A0ABU0DYZ7_9FIRM|nr:choline kinase family protein [Breznakia pachnodae]MDQ0359734.1 thiamine kinase-like enzyme [Breznakia pachnodae]
MIDNIIMKVFGHTDYTLDKLDKGITNHNYLLVINQDKYIVRIPYDDSTHVFERKHEAQILKEVTDLDVTTIFYDESSGIKITEYIEDLYEYEECPFEDKVERSAKLIKELHKKPVPAFSFEPIQTLYKYKEKVHHPIYDIEPYEVIIDQIQHVNHKQVLCHNDLVSGNLLFGKDRDYLIDYEYAASNDALFDVMSFISENQINDEHLRERFYQVYFDEITDEIRHDLFLWEAFHNILWCYWAMMLAQRREDPIYKQIAEDKFNALKRMKIV